MTCYPYHNIYKHLVVRCKVLWLRLRDTLPLFRSVLFHKNILQWRWVRIVVSRFLIKTAILWILYPKHVCPMLPFPQILAAFYTFQNQNVATFVWIMIETNAPLYFIKIFVTMTFVSLLIEDYVKTMAKMAIRILQDRWYFSPPTLNPWCICQNIYTKRCIMGSAQLAFLKTVYLY